MQDKVHGPNLFFTAQFLVLSRSHLARSLTTMTSRSLSSAARSYPRSSRPKSCAPRRRVRAQFCEAFVGYVTIIILVYVLHFILSSCFKSVPCGKRRRNVLTSRSLGAATAALVLTAARCHGRKSA